MTLGAIGGTLGAIGATLPDAGWSAAWQAAWNRQSSGLGQVHIAAFGDSVTQGYYTDAEYKDNGWVGLMTQRIALRTGVSAGTGLIRVSEEINSSLADDRITRTGTWTLSTAGGLYSHLALGQASATLTFGPVTCSEFRIVYATDSGGGAWTATIDGGAPQAFSSNGSPGLVDVTIDAGGSGSHTLVIECTGIAILSLVEAVANDATGVRVSRLARSNQETGNLLADASAYSSRQNYLLTDPDLVVLGFGLNDALYTGSTATFQTNLEALVADFQGLGASVLIMVCPPPNPATITDWPDYVGVMHAVAEAENCGIVDITEAWGTRAGNLTYYHDDVHPKFSGHADMARIITDAVLEAADPVTPSSWTPADLADLALWLDGDDDSTFTYSSGTLVSQWADKSGNGYHATQGTSANQASRSATVNGRGALWFDGTDDWMTLGDVLDLGTADLEVFVVAKRTNTGGGVIGKYKVSPADGSWLVHIDTGSSAMKWSSVLDAGAVAVATQAAAVNLDTHLVSAAFDRTDGQLRQRIDGVAAPATVNFTSDSASNRNTTTSAYIGALRNSADSGFQAGYYFGGYICEIVVVASSLSTGDRDSLEQYLARKWQVAPTLAS